MPATSRRSPPRPGSGSGWRAESRRPTLGESVRWRYGSTPSRSHGRWRPSRGRSASLRWLADSEIAKVPVAVAASGPRVIELAARHAERVDLTVGAEPDRLRWAIEVARGAGHASLGAFVNVAVHPDRSVARDL